MAQPITCLGHKEREKRMNKIISLSTNSRETPDESYRVLVKKGPLSVETSLKDLEEDYESKPEWKLVKEGGVLCVPVEELRIDNLPNPNHSGQVVFKEKRGGIESYPVGQTIDNLNEEIRDKYEEEKQKAKAAGISETEAEKKAFAAATKLPQFQAVKFWLDTNAEIKLKKFLENMIVSLKNPNCIDPISQPEADIGLEGPVPQVVKRRRYRPCDGLLLWRPPSFESL